MHGSAIGLTDEQVRHHRYGMMLGIADPRKTSADLQKWTAKIALPRPLAEVCLEYKCFLICTVLTCLLSAKILRWLVCLVMCDVKMLQA